MKNIIILSIVLFAMAVTVAVAEVRYIDDRVSGPVHVRDVDTIVVDGVPVRFDGIDGPELDTPAGVEAKRFLEDFLRDKRVECFLTGAKTYDRYVGICYASIGDRGWNLNMVLVAQGHALDCYRYSGGRYRHLETREGQARIKRASYCVKNTAAPTTSLRPRARP